ncbi:hypothetical protein [Photobacterium malacitanum]|uniref:hypothetical protein n=1 Tax=Photobacterium malacitanum TaxID=2204294 RepID=UPI0013563380|nr:hypothetical protein [Photobacterium malacitanum]
MICLGASSFASASSQLNIDHIAQTHPVYIAQTHPVYSDVIEAPIVNALITPRHCESLQQHQSESAPTQKHPTDRYVSNNGLPVSVYNTKLVWNFPSPTSIKSPHHSGKHHRLEVIDLNNIINTSTRSLNSFHHNADEIAPTFELAFELPVLPIPLLTIGYAEPLSPQTDWILTTKSTSSRISGWKESNQLYSHYGHSFVTA